MKTSIAKGAVLLTISSFVFAISGYLINIWLGRNLGPEAYGIYGIVISIWSFINLITVSGIPTAIAKHISANEKETGSIFKSAFNLQILWSSFITILFLLSAPLLAKIFKDERLVVYFRISALIIPFYSMQALFVSYYNGLRDFARQAKMHIIYPITKLIFVIALSYFWGIKGALIGFLIAPIITLCLYFSLPKQNVPNFPITKLILYSMPIIGFTIFFSLLMSIDLYFVKILLPNTIETGYYTAIQNIASIPFFLFSALSMVIFPNISKNVQKGLNIESSKIIRNSLRFVVLILLPLGILISKTAQPLIKLIFGLRYIQASDSLAILIAGYCFLTLFQLIANILNGAGKPAISLRAAFIGILSSSISCYILIPKLGIRGAAYSTTFASIISVIISSFSLRKYFISLINIRSLINALIASIIIYFICSVLYFEGVGLIIFYVVLGSLYLGLLFMLREFSEYDINLFTTLIPKWITKRFKK